MDNNLTLSDRIGAACGAAYILLINIGNGLASGASEDPHPTGAKDLADFAAHPTFRENAGFVMEVTGFLAFLFFLGWLVHALRERGGAAAWLAGVAGIAGTLDIAIKLGSAAPIVTGEIDHRELTPTLARVLADLNGAAFVITFLAFGTFLLAVGLAVLASGFLGRVAGWTAVVLGVAAIALTLATHVDPVNANPIPFLLSMVWVLVVSIRLAWKGPRRVAVGAGETTAAVPVPA